MKAETAEAPSEGDGSGLPRLEIEDEHLRWWQRALLASATGLCVSLALGVLVTFGLMLRLSPMVALEEMGIEQSMRVYWTFSTFLPPSHEADGPAFVFLDIDPIACERYRGVHRAQCRTHPLIDGALAADAIRWARESGARGIILDVAPFTDAADRSLVRDAALKEGPWIIAPLAGRTDFVGDAIIFNRDPENDLIPGTAEGPLRLALFDSGLAAGKDDDGMVLRHFRLAIPTRQPGSDTASWSAPTVGQLGATLFRKGPGSPEDCRFYAAWCRAHGRPVPPRVPGADPANRTSRIAFSLPSLAVPRSPEQQARLTTRYDPIYTHLSAGKLLEAGGGRFEPQAESVRGRIVLIGSSAAVAQDWTATPIGPMSGSEFLINVIRSLALAGDRVQEADHGPAPLGDLASKSLASVRGALIMTLAWLAIFAIVDRARSRTWPARLAVSTAVVAIFCLAMMAVALTEIAFLMMHVSEGMFEGHFIDLLTPVLALGLEGYAHAAIVVIAHIERGLEAVGKRIGRAAPPLFRQSIVTEEP